MHSCISDRLCRTGLLYVYTLLVMPELGTGSAQICQLDAERKLEAMEGVAAKIQGEINGLQSERAALLAKLEKIELALTKAQAAKVRSWRLLRLPEHLTLPI